MGGGVIMPVSAETMIDSETVIEENDIEQMIPYYVNITHAIGSITTTTGQITCSVSVAVKSSSSISIKMSLQKKNGSTWNTIKTWTKSYSDVRTANPQVYYASNKGSSYRMKYVVTVGSDKVTGTTSTVTGK